LRICNSCKNPQNLCIPEYGWEKPSLVCKVCAARIEKQRLALQAISESRTAVANELVQQKQGMNWGLKDPMWVDITTSELKRRTELSYSDLLTEMENNKEYNVALFPEAAFLDSVPCDPHSSPAEVLLVEERAFSSASAFWVAPKKMRSVTLAIVLPGAPTVKSVVFVVDPRGWTTNDLPRVTLSLSDSVDGKNTVSEDWNLAPDTAVAPGSVIVKPGTLLRKEIPSCSFEAKILSVKFDLPDGDETAQIHLGRLFVKGTRPSTQPMINTWKMNDSLFVPPASDGAPVGLPYIDVKRLEDSTHKLYGTIDCDLGTPAVPIHGFVLHIDHTSPTGDDQSSTATTAYPTTAYSEQQQASGKPGSLAMQQNSSDASSSENEATLLVANDEGSSCQVRLIRVTAIATTQEPNQQPVTTYTVAGKFLVPKCRQGTSLVFRFLQEHLLCSVIRFEYLANYGSTDYTAPGRFAVF